MQNDAPIPAAEALAAIWRDAGLDPLALRHVELPESAPCLASSFNVGAAAQASIGAAALAAETLYHRRTGTHQTVTVERHAAERECTGYFKLDGTTPGGWEKLSGLYPTADGHVRIHANFDHHRDGVLDLLELGPAETVEKDQLAAALAHWRADEFESAAAARGLVVAMVRTFGEWDAHPHAIASAPDEVIRITRVGDAEALHLPPADAGQRPLEGVKVLDLTRILAGPICGRTLAAYGADVMLVNSPNLPNISAISDTSRGKRSVHIDLRDDRGRTTLRQLLGAAHVFVQGYRPGGLAALGFAPEDLAQLRPGIVCVSLNAYGFNGPWAERRGFDSLVQTATGFNHAEAQAAGADEPKALPVQILDYASGFLMAFGAEAALLRQQSQGGSWHVEVSLLQTANWLRRLGRLQNGFDATGLNLKRHLAAFPCSHGALQAIPHAAHFERTPALWRRASSLPGSDAPDWD